MNKNIIIGSIVAMLALARLCAGVGFAADLEGGIQKVILKNGLKVILIEDHTLPLVSVQTWVRVGSVNENAQTNGLSHFLEHLIFKGTKKYPGQEITSRTETKGGVINAATSKEFTQFHIDIQSKSGSEAVKILCDAMINATFPPEEIEKERNVVLEEIRRHGDNPGSLLFDFFCESVFHVSDYKKSIIGSADVIKNVTRAEINAYYKKYYVPNNMILSIAGDFKSKEVLKIINSTLGREKAASEIFEPALFEKLHEAKTIKHVKDVEHSYYMSGFIGPEINSTEQFSADLASTILGGSRSSRIYRQLREEQKIVYSAGSSFWSQRGSGVFVLSALYDEKNEQKVQAGFKEILDKFTTFGLDENELKRAKEIIKSQWYFSNETIHDKAALHAYWTLQNRPDMPDVYIKGIESVCAKDITEFMSKYYTPQGLSEAIIAREAPKKK